MAPKRRAPKRKAVSSTPGHDHDDSPLSLGPDTEQGPCAVPNDETTAPSTSQLATHCMDTNTHGGTIETEGDLEDLEAYSIIDLLCSSKRGVLHRLKNSEQQIFEALLGLERFARAVVGPHKENFDSINHSHEILTGKVNFHASNFFKPFTWDNLTPDEQAKLNSWTPKAKQFLENRYSRRNILRAWIWHILDDYVFSADPATKWLTQDESMAGWKLLGKSMASLRAFDNNPDDELSTKYHFWRAISADLLGIATRRSFAFQSVTQDYVRQAITKEVGHLLISPTNDQEKEALDRSFQSVSQAAAQLDFYLLTTRAKVVVMWHDTRTTTTAEPKAPFGFPFHAFQEDELHERMVGFEWDEFATRTTPPDYEGRPVELVVMPGILARGTDPYTYWEPEWLKPMWKACMTVVVDVPPREPSDVEDEA